MSSCELGDAANLDGVGSLRTLANFKGYSVTLAEIVESNIDEFVGVEKEILFLPIAFDEPETLVGESGDCSLLHSNKKMAAKISSAELELKVDPRFSGSALKLMREG